MDRQTAAKFIPLLQAVADGKTIQQLCRYVGGKTEWKDLEDPRFVRNPEDYRVKEEPKELYRILDPYGKFLFFAFDFEGAERLKANEPGRTYEKYVQVL